MLEENIMEKVALLHGRDPLAWCILPGNSILVNCDTHTYFMKDPEVFGYYAEARTNFKVKSPQTEEVEKELRKRLIYLFDENREYKIVSLIDCRVVIIGK